MFRMETKVELLLAQAGVQIDPFAVCVDFDTGLFGRKLGSKRILCSRGHRAP